MTEQREELLEELRAAAFAIAYRMLGSVAEAEDIVQEALLRLHRALEQGERIWSPRAYLATVTTRLALDKLRSARARPRRGGHLHRCVGFRRHKRHGLAELELRAAVESCISPPWPLKPPSCRGQR